MNTDMQKSNGNGAAINPQAGTEAAARAAHDLVDRVAKIAGPTEEKLRKVSTSAEDSVKQSFDVARDKLGVARDKLNETAHDTLDIARNKSTVAKTSVSDFIQQHPLAALGIAFGTGVLLSYLTRGSSRSVNIERDNTDA